MSLLDHLEGFPAVQPVLGLDDLDVDRPTQPAGVGDGPSQAVGEERPRVVVIESRSTAPIEELLLAVASGDRRALVALKGRMGGLVRLNIRRVLRDASRSDAVTRAFFAEVLRDAIEFDPDRHSAQAWLLTRAHLRAMDELRSGHAAAHERIDLTTSVAESVNDLALVELGDHPVQVTEAGAREAFGDPSALLHR